MRQRIVISGRIRDYVIRTLATEIPRELGVTRIEFEGPFIAIYVRNRELIPKYLDLVKNLAKKVKKRVVLRVDKSSRLSPEEAKRVILSIVPPDAGVDPTSMIFDDTMGEVLIKAEKPGVVVGKGAVMRHIILAKTGWRPVVRRASPLESATIKKLIAVRYHEKNSEYITKFLRRAGERIHRDIVYKTNHVRITALGGFQEVGRSAILVETKESRVLLDLGINVGTSVPEKRYPHIDLDAIKLEELDAVVVTHAHLDHCGLVPLLYKYGYRGPVYVSKPTMELMAIMLQDYVNVMRRGEKRGGEPPPFGEKDIETMILHTIQLDYGEVTDIAPDMKVTLYNAGHILGSAIVHLHIGPGLHNIVYTGDFKYSRTRLLDKANDTFPRIETLIMESTYGATRQMNRRDAERMLIDIIKRVIERKGNVLIPVFAVGRGQEILLVLNDAISRRELPPIKIYVDGLISEVTAVHTEYPEYLNKEIKEMIYRGENPFVADYIEIVREEDKSAIVEDKPSIILATSGMLTGGPAVEYLRLLAPDPRNALIFVSYQAEGTLGRQIKDGMREITLSATASAPAQHPYAAVGPGLSRIEVLKIEMEVHSIDGFSGHSDQSELLRYIRSIKPKPRIILLNHGEPTAISRLASLASQMISRYGPRIGYMSPPQIYTPYVLDSLNLTARR